MDTGSFGAAAGGITPELQAAIQRRAGASSMPVSGGAPTFNPSTQPPQPPTAPAPGGAPVSNLPQPPVGPGATVPGQTQPALPFDSTESKMILQALSNRLKAGTDVQKAQLGLQPR